MLKSNLKENEILVDIKELVIEDKYSFLFPEFFITYSEDYLNGIKGVPQREGVYFIYEIEGTHDILTDSIFDKEIVYVGATQSLNKRVSEHFVTGTGNKSIYKNIGNEESGYNYMVSFILIEDKAVRENIERRFIDKLQPRYNKKNKETGYHTGGGIPKRVLTPKYLKAIEVLKENTYEETKEITGISGTTLTRIKKQYIEETGDVF